MKLVIGWYKLVRRCTLATRDEEMGSEDLFVCKFGKMGRTLEEGIDS